MPKKTENEINLDSLLPIPKGFSEIADLGVCLIKKNTQGSYIRIFQTFINSKIIHPEGVYKVKAECLGVTKND